MKNLNLLKIILKGGFGSGNFGHSGRPGFVGGSAVGINTIAKAYTGVIHKVANELGVNEVRKYRSMSFEEQMQLATDNRIEFNRLKKLDDDFRQFNFENNSPVLDMLSQAKAKELLNRIADPLLSQKDLSKAPSNDNYKAYFFQKYGICATNLTGQSAKRYAEALDAIGARHGLVGGFFIEGVDRAWQNRGERGGEFDSAYITLRLPNRLPAGSSLQDAKDVLNHEYGHYLDAYVLGSPDVEVKRLKGSRGDVTVRIDNKKSWLTSMQADALGYTRQDKPGNVKFDSSSEWSRDPDKVKRIGYKDKTPHELLAVMFEDYMADRLDKAEYSEFELNWFKIEIIPKL